MNPKLRVIFCGSGEFGLPTLVSLPEHAHQVVQVISQPDRPAGRGRGMMPTPISRWAQSAGVALLRTDNINQESLPEADVMVVIAFGQKIAPHIANHCRLGSINLHASRLPSLRGAAPINWAIINGDMRTGNSVIRLAQKMDAGAVLAQSELAIGPVETAGELHDRLAKDGPSLIAKVLDQLAAGIASETPQDESLATLAPKLGRQSAVLDFSRSADEVARRIRGLFPWPGCRVRLRDQQGKELLSLRLARARAIANGNSCRAGQILPNGTICAGNGAIEILQLQPESRSVMSLDDYRRGHPWPAGGMLEAVD